MVLNFKKYFILMSVFFLAFGIFSCKDKETTQSQSLKQDILYRGNTGEPGSLDPHLVTGTWENNIVGDLFVGLLTEAVDGKIIGGAAEKWDVSSDGKTYTFYLRKNGKWSDGKPLTAQDFVFSFRRILNPKLAAKYASILYVIKNAEALNTGKIKGMEKLGIKAVNDYTLQITLEAPTPYFLSLLTNFTTFPVPQHVVEKFDKDWIKPQNMVSNGAYKLAEWKSQSYIKALKNDFFYDSANVKIKEVYYYPTEDSASALKRFRAGELDMNGNFPLEQYQWLKENMPNETKVFPQQGIYHYVINHRLKKFQDKRVREALSLAVDLDTLINKVVQNGSVMAESFVPPLKGYKPAVVPFKEMPMPQRIIRAKKLLQEAGYSKEKPLTVKISYNTSEAHKKIAVAIASMWKKIGVESELLNSEAAVHFAELALGHFEIGRRGWIAEYPDAQALLRLLLPNKLNAGQYNNEKFNRKMQEAANTLDLKKRAKIMQEAEQIALDDFAVIPIYFYVSTNLVSSHVKGWQVNSRDVHRTRWMSKE